MNASKSHFVEADDIGSFTQLVSRKHSSVDILVSCHLHVIDLIVSGEG